jgi:alkanesulfonate monooxygenase SsuD/methylene tetrahydromethanopterin reductase-like flavin-dependent oxidoreductase (luciferase family)
MGPRALALTARCADGWEASYVSPADFAKRWARLAALLDAAGRPIGAFRRSVEMDAIVAEGPLDPLLDRFCAARGVARDHPLLGTVLAGNGRAVAERLAAYEAAGATDLMVGFADFPATRMLEALAAALDLPGQDR